MKLDRDARRRLRAQLDRYHAHNVCDVEKTIRDLLDDVDDIERRLRWHQCTGRDDCPVCSLGARDDRIIYPQRTP